MTFPRKSAGRPHGGRPSRNRDRRERIEDRPRTRAALAALVDAAMRLTGSTAGMAGLLRGGRIELHAFRPGQRHLGTPEDGAITAREGRRERIDVVAHQSEATGVRQPASYARLRLPILTPRGRLLGCIELHRKGKRPAFSTEHRDKARELLRVGALALIHAERLDREAASGQDANGKGFRPGQMFHTIDQPAMVLDARGRVVNANAAMRRLAGLPPDRLRGKTCREVYAGGNAPSSCCAFACEQGRAAEGPSHREAELNGRSILVSCSPVRDAVGRVLRTFHLATDITELKRIERELATVKDQAHSYLQIAAVMIVAIDASQRVTLVNRKAREILGYPASRILGRNWFDHFVPRSERERVKAAFLDLLRGETEMAEYYENPVLTRDGTERIIAWHNTTLRDARGSILGTLSSGTDITDRRRADEELRALNETLERRVAERTALAESQARQLRKLARELTQAETHERERVARVLHEHFQQLLVAARLHIEMLMCKERGSDLLAQLSSVNDILQESIRECSSLTVELCPPVLYDLGLVAGLDWLAERMRSHHALHVRVEADPAAEPVDLELRTFLFEAVRELLFNVVKHARVESATVTMDPLESGLIRIAVADRGCGFEPARFLPEREAQPGLGLFSIRGRLESLGGRMTVESTPGGGTLVALYAPRQV